MWASETVAAQPAGAWANLYLAVRRAASAQGLSFPYAGKDFVLLVRAYSQPFGLDGAT
jgi:hypothetical protein